MSAATSVSPRTNSSDKKHVNGHPPAAENGSSIDRLMRDMGSKKGFDPIPPDQYLVDLNDKDPVHRMMAFIRSRTIRKGYRSPFCVDEHGRPAKLEDIAAYFGWSMNHARQTWDKVDARGLARLDDAGRIWLCGDVALVPAPETEPEEEKANCTICEPEYIQEQIQQLTDSEKARLQSVYPTFVKLKNRLKADGMALIRAMQEDLDAQFFAQFNIERKRYEKRRESEGKEIVQVSLKDLPDEFVQILNGSVQNDSAALYNAENGSVQDAHPYMYLEEEEEREEYVSQSVSSTSEEDRLTDIAEAIPVTLTKQLGETPSPELLRRISTKLGDAPLESFVERIFVRWKSITSLGLLENLALDVGTAWQAAQQAKPNANPPPLPAPTAEAIGYAREILSDPEATENEKNWARELLNGAG